MSLLPARAPQTSALVTHLQTTLGGALVGRGAKPDGAGWQGAPGHSQFIGYVVLRGIPGGEIDGTLGQPNRDGDTIIQADCYGADKDQAEQLGDAVDAALLGVPPLTIAGRAVRWCRPDIPRGDARIDPDQPSIWVSTGRYGLGTTPTT